MTPQQTRVVLTRPHTHAGKAHGPGDRIEVDVDTAEWLFAHDIAKPEPPPVRIDPDLKPLQRKESKQ